MHPPSVINNLLIPGAILSQNYITGQLGQYSHGMGPTVKNNLKQLAQHAFNVDTQQCGTVSNSHTSSYNGV